MYASLRRKKVTTLWYNVQQAIYILFKKRKFICIYLFTYKFKKFDHFYLVISLQSCQSLSWITHSLGHFHGRSDIVLTYYFLDQALNDTVMDR